MRKLLMLFFIILFSSVVHVQAIVNVLCEMKPAPQPSSGQ
jgi:hypothetical protein